MLVFTCQYNSLPHDRQEHFQNGFAEGARPQFGGHHLNRFKEM